MPVLARLDLAALLLAAAAVLALFRFKMGVISTLAGCAAADAALAAFG